MSQNFDVSTLPLQQLAEIRKQLEAEVDHLSQSSTELRQVLGKFIDCSQSVKVAAEKAIEGAEIMVPLTSSLYVPGKAGSSKFIVDVGTNYYVEKTAEEAEQFFERKIKTLNQNLVDLEKLLTERVTTLRNIDAVYKTKFREALEKAEKENPK